MHERELLSFESALARVLDAAPDLGLETVELARSPGRVLAEDIRCDRDVPAADVSAMDGFAVRSVDLVEPSSLRLVGDALAGRPYDGVVGCGECTRVMTGGLVPQGSDAVVPVEATSGYDALDGGRIEFSRGTTPGDNVRPRASVRKQGDVVLARGGVIRAPQVAVLAGQGHVRVQVARRPRVAILPTGDEVVPIDVVPTEGQVRNSNAHCLHAQVEAAGGEASLHAILRDREGDTLDRLRDALETHDLVCTIGGVSMGTRDLVRGAFDTLGGTTLVESVRIKPGKPTLFGSYRRADGSTSHLLGLPGNPASSFTIFELFGAPWIRKAIGRDESTWLLRRRATLVEHPVRANWRMQLLPALVKRTAERAELMALDQRSSADLFSLAEANALVVVPPEAALAVGQSVEYVEFAFDGR